MKVFISWSGKRSKALANALRDWLPLVLQYVEPWVSDKDISAGERWSQVIAAELEASNFGIICITPENLHSEWILFEAGALSKSMLEAKLIPLVYGLEISDLSGPLSQFQAQKMDESGMMEIVRSINKVSETKARNEIVDELVPAMWPKLDQTLKSIPDTESGEKHMRPQHEIMEELVTSVRGISSRIRDFGPEFDEREFMLKKRRYRRFHPMMIEEISMMLGEDAGAPLQLLVLAGIFREDFPWISEILTETYREIRDGEIEKSEKALHRLRRMMKQMMHSPMIYELSGGSKEMMRMAEELPMFLDRAIHRMLPDKKNSNIDET